MKLTELTKELVNAIAQYGDIDVFVCKDNIFNDDYDHPLVRHPLVWINLNREVFDSKEHKSVINEISF